MHLLVTLFVTTGSQCTEWNIKKTSKFIIKQVRNACQKMKEQRNIYCELLIETQLYIKVFVCVVYS